MKFRALDLFCCAGGATRGLQMAGFHVTGVDIRPQPRYCGDEFHQADALTFPLEGKCTDCDGKGFVGCTSPWWCGPALCDSCDGRGNYRFDFIWASPPCQAHTALKTMHNAKPHADLIPATRARLKAWGGMWVMENVIGAPLGIGIQLCGTSFGLGIGDAELRRHRHFESNVMLFGLPCQHGSDVIGVYGGHARNRKRTIGVYGEGARDSRRKFDKGHPDFSVEDARAALGIDWMTIAELSQAIPPAYSEFIGRQVMQILERAV